MKTFDSALCELYDGGKITLQEALLNADSRNNLRLNIQLKHGNNPPSVVGQEAPTKNAGKMAARTGKTASGAGLSLEPIKIPADDEDEEANQAY